MGRNSLRYVARFNNVTDSVWGARFRNRVRFYPASAGHQHHRGRRARDQITATERREFLPRGDE